MVEPEPTARFCHVSEHHDSVGLSFANQFIHASQAKSNVPPHYEGSAALFVEYPLAGHRPDIVSRYRRFDEIPRVDKAIVDPLTEETLTPLQEQILKLRFLGRPCFDTPDGTRPRGENVKRITIHEGYKMGFGRNAAHLMAAFNAYGKHLWPVIDEDLTGLSYFLDKRYNEAIPRPKERAPAGVTHVEGRVIDRYGDVGPYSLPMIAVISPAEALAASL